MLHASGPEDAQLERALRDAVRAVYGNGDLENLTVKRIRRGVEEELGLDEGFFKEVEGWKNRSKEIIQSEVDARNETHPSSQLPTPSPAVVKPKQPAIPISPEPAPRSKQKDVKRATVGLNEAKPKKKRKKSTSDVEESASEKEQKAATALKGDATKREPTLSTELGTDEEKDTRETDLELKKNGDKADGSESEMSVLLDEDPNAKKSKKRRRKSESKSSTKKSEVTKPKRASDGTSDPDAEEIKRLQGWLIKCGIRKMWYKELAPYDTSKAKIRHLKEMLADAGMTGRYSKEKADQIRDERELKADLEAVQEGEKVWGKAEDEGEEDGGGGGVAKPRRRLARGLQGLDFLNDDDGEETD